MLLYTKGDTEHIFLNGYTSISCHIPPPPPRGCVLDSSIQETQIYIFNNIISFLLLFIICQIFTPINLMSMHNLISYGYINAQSNKLWIHWSKVWLYSILLYTEGDIELTHILTWLHINHISRLCHVHFIFIFIFSISYSIWIQRRVHNT